jgi:hypothetical protein
MAREAGWDDHHAEFDTRIDRLVALARADEREETNRRANASWTLMCKKMVAAEREACAKVCDDNATDLSEGDWDSACNNCACHIRARGQA